MATAESGILKNVSHLSASKTTKDNPRYAFQYDIELIFVDGEGNTYNINKNFIKFIVFDYEYEENTIPVIYVSFSTTNEIYDMVLQNAQVGKVFFSLYRDNKYSESSLSVRTIEGEFSYIPSTGNINYTENLSSESTADNSYKEMTIALIDEEKLNMTKMYTNKVFKDIDTDTIIGIVLEKLIELGITVIKAPKYSVPLENEIIPPMTSVKTFLSYLFNQAPFYDTDFVFFLDFDKCYLLDKNGEGCEVDDGTLHTVIFEICDVTDRRAYFEGIEIDEGNGAYMVYINPADANASINRSQDRVANRLVVIGEEGYDEEMDVNIDVNSTAFSEDKLAFIRGSDAILLKNIMESNTIFFTLQKPYIDANVFTPNKKFLISNYGYEYNGVYTLAYKKEIISNNGGAFNEFSEFGLRKVGNISETGGIGAQSASNQAKSKSYSTNDLHISTSSTRGNSEAAKNTKSSNYTVSTIMNPRSSNRNAVTASKSTYVRAMLDASGPSKTIKANKNKPDLLRKIK